MKVSVVGFDFVCLNNTTSGVIKQNKQQPTKKQYKPTHTQTQHINHSHKSLTQDDNSDNDKLVDVVEVKEMKISSVFNEGEREIYSSIYVYEHGGLVPGYQSLAEYHKDIDTVVVQFVNTTNFDGYNWSLSEIVYDRIIKILKSKKNLATKTLAHVLHLARQINRRQHISLYWVR